LGDHILGQVQALGFGEPLDLNSANMRLGVEMMRV